MKDANGQEIKVGDTVVVAGRQGSSQWLTKTEVVGTTWEKGSYDWKTQTWPMVEIPVLVGHKSHWDRKTKTSTERAFHYPYRGRAKAIMVIAKGPDASPPAVTVEDHDLGDLDPKELNAFDPVPGVRW